MFNVVGMKYIMFVVVLFIGTSAFAGGFTINDVSDKFKLLKYKGSKVAELKYSCSWYVYCLKGRSGGSSSEPNDTLKESVMRAMTVCDTW